MDLEGRVVPQGWIIYIDIINEFQRKSENVFFDETTIFHAFNLLEGISLNVYDLGKNEGWRLEHLILNARANGTWKYEDNSNFYQEIKTISVVELEDSLQKILNPEKINLVPLTIFGGWMVCKNLLFHSADQWGEAKFIFFATNESKVFIDVSYVKNSEYPFIVTAGINRSQFSGIRMSAEKPLEFYNFKFREIQTVVQFINKVVELSINYPIQWNTISILFDNKSSC